MRKTKIVATIGPASNSKEMLGKLIDAGVDVARINFSHGEYDVIRKVVKHIRAKSNTTAILLDTKGPEIRTGKVENNEIELNQWDNIMLTTKQVMGNPDKITVNYKKLHKLEKGNILLLDDGMIELEVIGKVKEGIKAKVKYGGFLGSKKTVSIRGHSVDIPFLSEKDKEDIKFGIKQKMDFVAASFVRRKKDVEELRAFLKKHKSPMQIIAKIEHGDAVDNIEDIIQASDGIMVARGDLGVEMPLERVPDIQQEIIERCNTLGKPVIVATQMLESMRNNPRPTRAEVGDVAQAILQGADAVMLSAETAAGKYPIRSVDMMVQIAKEYDEKTTSHIREDPTHGQISLFITRAAHVGAKALNARFIFTPTHSGFTARNVSRFKPPCPIIALAPNIQVVRQLQLSWGVLALEEKNHQSDLQKIVFSFIKKAVKDKHLKPADKVIITAGYKAGKTGRTNLLEIYRARHILDWKFN